MPNHNDNSPNGIQELTLTLLKEQGEKMDKNLEALRLTQHKTIEHLSEVVGSLQLLRQEVSAKNDSVNDKIDTIIKDVEELQASFSKETEKINNIKLQLSPIHTAYTYIMRGIYGAVAVGVVYLIAVVAKIKNLI